LPGHKQKEQMHLFAAPIEIRRFAEAKAKASAF
jgi:hypothetical protein